MLGGITLGWLALAGRALTLGVMHPLLKRLNEGHGALVVTALFSFFGALASLPAAVWSLTQDPLQLANLARWAVYPFAGSVAFVIGMVSFNRALRVGDLSLLSPLTALTFIFVYILDLAVGNRSLTLTAVAGVAVVTFGMALLNLRRGVPVSTSLAPFAVLRRPGAWGAVIFAATLAVARVVDNAGIQHTGALVYAAVANLMVFALCLPAIMVRRELADTVRLARERGWLAALIALLGLGNYLCLLVAFRYFPPSTVEPVSQLGIVLSVLVGAWHFREPLHLRWLAALLVVAGAALVVSAP